MAARVCSEPGCPTLVSQGSRGGRCTTHQRAADKARGTSRERGYGAEHHALKRHWQARIDSGESVTCWRCGVQLVGTDWHLDHTDDRSGYRGPACAHCNLQLAGQAAHNTRGRAPDPPCRNPLVRTLASFSTNEPQGGADGGT